MVPEIPWLRTAGTYGLSPLLSTELREKIVWRKMGNSDSKEAAASENSTPNKLVSSPSCSPISKGSNCSPNSLHQKYFRRDQRQQYDSLETVGTVRTDPVQLRSSPPPRSHKRFCSTADQTRSVMSAPTSVTQINSFSLDTYAYQRHKMMMSSLKTPPTNFYRKSYTGGLSSNETSTNGSRDDEEFLTCSYAKSHPGGVGVAEVVLLQQQSGKQPKKISRSLEPLDSRYPGSSISDMVVKKGLNAKLRGLSSWFLQSTTPNSSPKAASECSYTSSLKRHDSIRPASTTPLKAHFDEKSSSHTGSRLKRSKSNRSQLSDGSGSNLNSLCDGRTPWPVPWLDALFLPEFPNRAALSERHFMIVGTIAKGTYGKVYRVALRSQPSSIFAMKVQRKTEVISKDTYQLTGSPFIAQLHCAWQNRSNLYIVTKFIDGYGDLYQLWRDTGPFSENVARIYCAELACALDYIHSRSVIHRDMKMENIMLDQRGHVQLIDFGMAKWLSAGDRTTTICGTLQYMAPEVLRMEPYGHTVDWWSLGVLLHTLVTGMYPFGSAENHLTMKIHSYDPPYFLSPTFGCLLRKLLCGDPSARLQSYAELQSDPFFQDFNFDDISSKELDLSRVTESQHAKTGEMPIDTDNDNEDSLYKCFDESYEERLDLLF